MSKTPIIFTPDDEPYLGRASVYHFDLVIVACLRDNAKVASYTHSHPLSELQQAACEVIPQGINLALSTRELIRQGYLFGAVVLLRSLVERAAIISYLRSNPNTVSVWKAGWDYRARPSLADMLSVMNTQSSKDEIRKVTQTLNHIVHGDPAGAKFNLVGLDDDAWGFAIGKNLTDPQLCDFICEQAMCYLIVLAANMAACFPEVQLARQPS